ncbi:MAG: hypothetical protein AB1489_24015 [Acidobacteriota bacterium]
MTDKTYEEIKKIIFARKLGECRSAAEWQQLYANGSKNLPINHLTSCANCLDKVNHLLGLPLLSERHPFDTIMRDSGNDDPFNPTANDDSPTRKKDNHTDQTALLRRLEEARRQHQAQMPQEITLCINGWPLSSCQVQAGANTLTVRPRLEEPLENLELLDENSRILYHLLVDDECASGADQCWPSLMLGARRTLDINISWMDDYPEIHLRYTAQELPAPLQESTQESWRATLMRQLSEWWAAIWRRELIVVAAVLLILILIPVGLWIEQSRSQTVAKLAHELARIEQERNELNQRLAEEQARRQAAEATRDELLRHPQRQDTVKEETPISKPTEIAIAKPLHFTLQQGPDDDTDAFTLGATRGSLGGSLLVPRSNKAKFALRLPRYAEDGETMFNTYLIKLTIPGQSPLLARFKKPSPSDDPVFVVVRAELTNTDKLALNSEATAVVIGITGKGQSVIGSVPLRFE